MPLPPRLTELVYAAPPVELRFVLVESDTIAAEFFQIVAKLVSIFHDCGFAGAFAQITAKLHFIFSQLRVILRNSPPLAFTFSRSVRSGESPICHDVPCNHSEHRDGSNAAQGA